MCGIVGVASTEGMKNRSCRAKFMRMGLDIDSWRGWESTGMALVPESMKESPIVYKRALNGRDFIQLNQVEKYINDIEKYPVVIGHNRAATTGRGNIVDHNAHPFQYGRITLVHNGHIRNTHELKGANTGAGCLVDSSHVAFSMNANGELETLQTVEGGFVFVWWNSETNTLNIARNSERPMHMAFAVKENTFYWASELTELLHLLQDVEIDEDIGILYPMAWNWYQFNLKDLREYKKVPFVKSQGRQQGRRTKLEDRGTGGTGAAAWTDAELEAWEQLGVSEKNLPTRTSQNTEAAESSTCDEIEEIRQDVANQRLKDAKVSGIPTSKKRMSKAKLELKKLGIEYQGLRNCVPISWCKYKNQNNLGSVLAKTKKEGHLIEILQVRHENYVKFEKLKNLLVECVNVRNGPNSDFRIVGVVSPRMKTYMERIESAVDDKEGPLGSTDRSFHGPDNSKISRARFMELVTQGCANCCKTIEAIHHEFITWIGSPPQPLCEDCSQEPGVMELLGVRPEYRKQIVH